MSDLSEIRPAGPPVSVLDSDGPTDRVQQSYFGFAETKQTFFPDGVTFVEHRTLNEGDRRQYQNETNREVTFKRGTGDASMKMRPGDEKHLLLGMAVVGWNLIDMNKQPVPFSRRNLEAWLAQADPKIVDLIEKDIRKNNSWLLADMSVEDIDRQIDELREMRETKLKEEEGNDS